MQEKKKMQTIELADLIVNHPNSAGLLGRSDNTAADIYILFHWQDETFLQD